MECEQILSDLICGPTHKHCIQDLVVCLLQLLYALLLGCNLRLALSLNCWWALVETVWAG